jgi:hypothetical protein
MSVSPDAADPTEATVPAGDFLRDSQVVEDPDRPGWFLGSIPEAWKVLYSFGGMSMAVALRGAERALDRPDLHLLSANAVFSAPVACGPVTIEARPLRSGRTAAQVLSLLHTDDHDDVALCVTATWGERYPDAPVGYVDVEFPEGAGVPDDHEPPPPRPDDAPFPVVNFHEQTDWRPAIGNRFWDPPEQWVDGPARFGSWTRLIEAPMLPDGTLDPVSLCIPADTMGPAIGQKLGPERDGEDDINFFTVTLELGLQVLAPARTPWLFQLVRAPHVADGYAMSTVELWDGDRQLVAVGDQRARLRFFTPGDGFFSG